jgi:hypothetical protein
MQNGVAFQRFQPAPGSVAHSAEQFYQATLGMTGTDIEKTKAILKHAHQQGNLPALKQAIVQKARQEGFAVNDTLDILHHEFSNNALKRVFKAAPRQSVMDVYNTGQDQYRASKMQYRLFGMWRAIANFLTVSKQYPLMSGAIIGLVAHYGGKYPFLGAFSGVGILGWSGANMARQEWRARGPGMTAEKAEALVSSGENLTAFALTASGGDGIYKVMAESVNRLKAAPLSAKNLFNIVGMQLNAHDAMGGLQSLRFVMGLFDNVIPPFNAVANRLNGKKES